MANLNTLPPPQSRNEALLMGILGALEGSGGLQIHVCTSDEYDHSTGVPTVASPASDTLYLVPASDATTGNLFDEWVYAAAAWEKVGSTSIDVPVQDVQVNGTSILSGGVANIVKATDAQVKAGTENGNMLVPSIQDASAFFGLAKAAGDTSQSASDNAVGAYTDAAKVAIQKMLGVYEAPWELINEGTFTNATDADYIINTDTNGQAFELTDVALKFETPVQDVASAKSNQAIRLFYGSSSSDYYQVEVGTWTQAASSSTHGAYVFMDQDNGLIRLISSTNTTSTNSGNLRMRYGSSRSSSGMDYQSDTVGINQINIRSVLGTGHFILYGKRKWTI